MFQEECASRLRANLPRLSQALILQGMYTRKYPRLYSFHSIAVGLAAAFVAFVFLVRTLKPGCVHFLREHLEIPQLLSAAVKLIILHNVRDYLLYSRMLVASGYVVDSRTACAELTRR